MCIYCTYIYMYVEQKIKSLMNLKYFVTYITVFFFFYCKWHNKLWVCVWKGLMQCILFFCCTQRITLPYICIFYHTKNSLVYIRVERFSCGKSIQIGYRSRQHIYQSNKKKIAVYRGWKQFVVTLHHVMLYTSALKMYAHFLQEMHGIIQFQNRLYQFVLF